MYRRYGGPDVVELADVPTPVPQAGQILVRVHATTVTAADWRARSLAMPRGFGPIARLAFGVRRPRQPILGTELAGIVDAVGEGVTTFRPGDEVLAFTGAKFGCHAHYRAVDAKGPVALKPDTLSFEEAASLPFGGTTALHYLRQGRVRAGEKVLVVGASGNVGTALVQLAKHLGADVTGVTSTPNVDLVRSIGADRVIDYTQDDFTNGEASFDVIADTVGATTLATARRVLNENGRLLAIAADLPGVLAAVWAPLTGSRRVVAGPAPERADDLRRLAELAESGALRPVIGRRYAFSQMVDAHAHVETRRKRGSTVVRVHPGE